MKDLISNKGVILVDKKPEDYVFGGETKLGYEEVLPLGNWNEFLPTNERQSNGVEDYMNCVSQAGHNSLETQLNRLTGQNLMPQGLLNIAKTMGWIDDEGHWNFNDCFTAKMAGTSHRGLTMPKFWDCVRHNGLLGEGDWHKTSDNLKWDDYYIEIPQELKNRALEFLKWFTIEYEWLWDSPPSVNYNLLEKNLKQAPIHVATATCSPWSYNVVPSCGASASHATMVFNNVKDYIEDFDTYEPFKKKLAPNYVIHQAMKGVVRPKTFSINISQVAYIYCLRDDVALAFPGSNKFYSTVEPTYSIYDWCRDYGVYDNPEVFIDNILDYSKINKGRVEEASQIDPQIKKKRFSLFLCLNNFWTWLLSLLS